MRDLSEEELTDIAERLMSLGYEIKQCDKMAISFAANGVRNRILTQINHEDIPDGLQLVYIDMACGEFLNSKFSTNDIPGMDLDGALQSVTMGDVSVSYNQSLTPAAKFKLLIDSLINGRKGDIACYRQIRW